MEKVGYDVHKVKKSSPTEQKQQDKAKPAQSVASSRAITTAQSSVWVPKGIVESEHRYM